MKFGVIQNIHCKGSLDSENYSFEPVTLQTDIRYFESELYQENKEYFKRQNYGWTEVITILEEEI